MGSWKRRDESRVEDGGHLRSGGYSSYSNGGYEGTFGREGRGQRRAAAVPRYDVDEYEDEDEYRYGGQEEDRPPSDRTASEYMVVANERISSTPLHNQSTAIHHNHANQHNHTNQHNQHNQHNHANQHNHDTQQPPPEIFVTDYSAPFTKRPPSEFSHYSGRTYRSGASTTTSRKRVSRQGGVVVETMSAPNPFCPNTRGACCLMLLLNLGLILLTLGFVIVLQLFKPPFVWYLGIVFLCAGFATLVGSIVYWVTLCRAPVPPAPLSPAYPYPYSYYEPGPGGANGPGADQGQGPGADPQLYWTHHWQKRIQLPQVHRTTTQHTNDDKMSDRYSEQSAKSNASNKSDPRPRTHTTLTAY